MSSDTGVSKRDFETQIAVGDDADQLIAVDHRHAGDVMGAGQFEHFANTGGRPHSDRVFDDTTLEFFDRAHLVGLLLAASCSCE